MHLLKPLEELADDDQPITGGKAVSLGKMIRAGLAVPDGFVIITSAPEQYRTHPKIFARSLYYAFDQLHADTVAVRSSAIAEDARDVSWAGQFDTFLNVDRLTLLEKIQDCWQSAHSDRVAAYAQQQGAPDEDQKVAVIVQCMVQSAVSGVAFSIHPVTGNTEHIVIEAGLGLGEAIVSGQITPDMYIVDKPSGRVVSKQIARQTKMLYRLGWRDTGMEGIAQKLSDKQIGELASIVRRVEDYYGFPVDVEWALDKGAFFVVQSRPITTIM